MSIGRFFLNIEMYGHFADFEKRHLPFFVFAQRTALTAEGRQSAFWQKCASPLQPSGIAPEMRLFSMTLQWSC
jgi:hypothetical protein